MNHVAIRSRSLNIISLCSGGGGLDLGLELAIPGARPIVYVEREAFAVAHLVAAMQRKLMAPGPVWSDVGTFDGRPWRGVVDCLIGGIPCQPHSLAGRKLGSLDERDLWSDARRIIVQARPWVVIIENVAGMLSAGDDEIAGAERVYRDLRKLGFEVEGGLFTAAEVGASHQRERIFILAVADRDNQHGDRPRLGWARRRGQPADRCSEVSGVGLADAYSERLERIGADLGAEGRSDAGRPSRLCDGTALEHADADSSQKREGDEAIRRGRAEQPTGTGAAGGRPNVGDTSSERLHATAHSRADSSYEGAWSRHEEPERRSGSMVHTLGSGRAGRTEVAQRGTQQRTPDEWAGRPTLFPPGPADIDGWREILTRSPELVPAFRRVADGLASRLDISRVDRLRMLGNGVVPLQAGYAIRTLATRLAETGSSGAAQLVRLMEGTEE